MEGGLELKVKGGASNQLLCLFQLLHFQLGFQNCQQAGTSIRTPGCIDSHTDPVPPTSGQAAALHPPRGYTANCTESLPHLPGGHRHYTRYGLATNQTGGPVSSTSAPRVVSPATTEGHTQPTQGYPQSLQGYSRGEYATWHQWPSPT